MTVYAPRSCWVTLLLSVAGCEEPVVDDLPPSTPENPSAARRECDEAIERAATECPPLSTITIVELGDEPPPLPLMIVDLDEVATVVPGGAYVPVSPSLAGLGLPGHVLADDDECQVSCVVECDVSTHALCLALDQDDPACLFCGPQASLEDCESFVAACQP